MARTTPLLVAGVIEVDLDEIPDLTPFIDVANELVTEVCENGPADPAYSLARLTYIETWLAAHFYAIRDPRTAIEGVGTLRTHYMHKVDLMLKQTTYGQQAMLLDTAGGLAALSNSMNDIKGARSGVYWVGTPHEESEL